MAQRDPLGARGRAVLLQSKVKKQTLDFRLVPCVPSLPHREATGILWEDGDGWQSWTCRLQEQH